MGVESPTSHERYAATWLARLSRHHASPFDSDRAEKLDAFIDQRVAAGGAAPPG